MLFSSIFVVLISTGFDDKDVTFLFRFQDKGGLGKVKHKKLTFQNHV